MNWRLAGGVHEETAGIAPRRDQRGDLLIDCLIAMVLIAIAATGYLVVSSNVNHAQRADQVTDSIAQAAHANIEKLDAAPWNQVAGDGTDCPSGATALTGHDHPVLKTSDTTHRVHYTLETSVCLVNPVTGVAYDGYAHKRVIVRATYTPEGASTERHVTYAADLTATVNDANPSPIEKVQ